jgi:hypothetical protein
MDAPLLSPRPQTLYPTGALRDIRAFFPLKAAVHEPTERVVAHSEDIVEPDLSGG